MTVTEKKKENSLFSIYDPLGVKLLICLRLQFSYLSEHKFRYWFDDIFSPMWGCNALVLPFLFYSKILTL